MKRLIVKLSTSFAPVVQMTHRTCTFILDRLPALIIVLVISLLAIAMTALPSKTDTLPDPIVTQADISPTISSGTDSTLDSITLPLPTRTPKAKDLAVWIDRVQVKSSKALGSRVHQYFVPFHDRELINLFKESDECLDPPTMTTVSNTLTSFVSLTASSNNTVYFYDHYEDGYDTDPFVPTHTTEIGVLNAGEARVFAEDIDTTDLGNPNSLHYGGRDRITVVGEEVSVIRAAFPSLVDSQIGSRLAGAWEVEEIDEWGKVYVIPVGEDWNAAVGHDFEFTGASFMALQNDTELSDGENPLPFKTLKAGETYFVNGAGDGEDGLNGLDSGDIIIANHPIQVHVYSSICNLHPSGNPPWSGNGYTLQPRDQWSSHYWSPVPNRASCPDSNSGNVDIILYNPGPHSGIEVVVDDGTPNTVLLPLGVTSLIDLNGPLSEEHSVEIYSQDKPFWGVVNMDTRDTAYEWGYSLIPEEELSSQVVLGWAPGNFNPPPLGKYPPSGNLAWVTPITDTTVFADFDQDGTVDFIDCNGDGDTEDTGVDGICNETTSTLGITVTQGQVLRIADPSDADLTGALIYTKNLNEKIAIAWGQDPCVAEPVRPYLDMGYTALPIDVLAISKFDALAHDLDDSGDITPGDHLAYTVTAFNNGYGPMTNVVMTDVLPYTYTDFIVDSIVAMPLVTVTCEYDLGDGSFSYTPVPTGTRGVDPAVQQIRCIWPRINAKNSVNVTFQLEIEPDISWHVRKISNQATVRSDQTRPKKSQDPDDPADPDTDTLIGQPILWLKTLSSDPGAVEPGGLITYTIVVSNVGTATAWVDLLADDLPPWVTYVTGTLDLSLPIAHISTETIPISRAVGDYREIFGDNFDADNHSSTTGYGGNDGTLEWRDHSWSEVGESDGSFAGDVRIISETAGYASPPSYLQLRDSDGADAGLRRCANLSDFTQPHLSYQMWGNGTNTGSDDMYRVEITGTQSITVYTEINSDEEYILRDLDLTIFAGDSLVCIAFIGDAGMGGSDQYNIDDVFVYEASPVRYEATSLTKKTAVTTSRSITNTDPLTYTRIPSTSDVPAVTNAMYITRALPFPPQGFLTASFQVRVIEPLTDGLVMTNTASITATNIHTTPYDLEDDEQTIIQHGLMMTKKPLDHSSIHVGELVTFTIYITNAGESTIITLPLTDTYDTTYLSFKEASPKATTVSTGTLEWSDLAANPPSGYGKDLRPGNTFVITVTFELTRILEFSYTHRLTTTNYAGINNARDDTGKRYWRRTHTDIEIEPHRIYLPLVLRPLPPPTLYPIDNKNIDDDYVIFWSKVNTATDYKLGEATNNTCTSPSVTPVSGTSHTVSERERGHYCYCVQACSSGLCSEWSNVECVGAWWENENNSTYDQANGPLISDKDYGGLPNDTWDCFKFNLDKSEEITVQLVKYDFFSGKNFQFQLLDEEKNLVDYTTDPAKALRCPNPDYKSCGKGMYYIRIRTATTSTNFADHYILTATFHQMRINATNTCDGTSKSISHPAIQRLTPAITKRRQRAK